MIHSQSLTNLDTFKLRMACYEIVAHSSNVRMTCIDILVDSE